MSFFLTQPSFLTIHVLRPSSTRARPWRRLYPLHKNDTQPSSDFNRDHRIECDSLETYEFSECKTCVQKRMRIREEPSVHHGRFDGTMDRMPQFKR
jgi:hypothetical protein